MSSCTVTISPKTLTLDEATSTLVAIATPASGSFSWATNNAAVVEISVLVDYQAVIRPLAPGTALITVTFSANGSACTDSAVITVLRRNFILVYGDRGKGEHNAGGLFQLAAETHEKEVRSNTAPGVVAFLASDTVTTSHISTVSELSGKLGVNNVLYLAYFGHSWADTSTGWLYIGQDDAPDTNLSDGPGPDNTSTATLPKSAFLKNATIRLFGCRCGFGANPAAQQLAKALSVTVFGFDNSGGSIFTNDRKLGHWERATTYADRSAHVVAGKDIWMVPWDGTPHFKQF